ncbi:hypothetical protein [Elioraea sp.]|uniref:hypothetical protein n=1 Tax=Elioraea sp. TaxID=2185103 RepID=UPI003F6EA2F4
MLTLDIAREPRWLDLPQGVRLLAKPLDRITRAAAEGAAQIEEAKVLLGEAAQQERSVFNGLYFMLLVRLFARRVVTAWEGVGDRDGAPLALSPTALDALMEHDDMAVAFWDAMIGRPDPAEAEGNG